MQYELSLYCALEAEAASISGLRRVGLAAQFAAISLVGVRAQLDSHSRLGRRLRLSSDLRPRHHRIGEAQPNMYEKTILYKCYGFSRFFGRRLLGSYRTPMQTRNVGAVVGQSVGQSIDPTGTTLALSKRPECNVKCKRECCRFGLGCHRTIQ